MMRKDSHMKEYQPTLYGDLIAAVYDIWYPAPEEQSIQFLAKMAGAVVPLSSA
jgi:hypothetical protein